MASSGEVRKLADYPLSAWLWDFDVNKSTLKPAHIAYLSSLGILINANAASNRGTWIVSITGRTSGTGSDADNDRLARARAASAADFLKGSLRGVHVDWRISSVGERGARNNVEDAWPRSVVILVLDPVAAEERRKRDDKPDPQPHPEPLPDKLYALRMTYFTRGDLSVSPRSMGPPSAKRVKALSVSAGATRIQINVQILDLEAREAASYMFVSYLLMGRVTVMSPSSPSLPLPYGLSISLSGERQKGRGPWIPLLVEGRSTTVGSFKDWYTRITEIRGDSVDLIFSKNLVAIRGIEIQRLRRPDIRPGIPATGIETFLPPFGGVPLEPIGKVKRWEGPTPLDELADRVRGAVGKIRAAHGH